jgi:tetratricopeptide (TPR) repeat protein
VPPLLDRDLLTQITGEDGFLERALAWGLPMTRTEGGWWVLPDPVREHLAALGRPGPLVRRTAAAYYERHGAFGTALQMLLGAGDVEAAAALLDEADPWVIDTVDALELLSVLDAIPGAVLDRFPRALLSVARCCAGSWMTAHGTRLMARLDAMLSEDGAPELRRALDVELLVQAVNRGDGCQAEVGARRVLAGAGAGERLTRARALTVIGQALCQRRDDQGRLDTAALGEAAEYLGRASEIQLGLGNRPAAATITIFWALWVELVLGRPQSALRVLNKGLALAAEHPRRFVQILWCRAHVLTELGRQADVGADLDEVVRIAGELGDRWIVPYVAWERMSGASLRGDAEATLRHAREAQAEAGTGYWWKVDGAEFLADAADCLDRVGCTPLATEYLERARVEPQRAEPQIAMAECALLARHGDPELAETALVAAPRHGTAPREQWRLTLFQAYAAYRRGDPGGGALAARAFEQAAALGQPHLPLLRERELTESLLALAVETRLPAARALEHSSLPMAVAVLGRFELTCGGRMVALGAGQEARLLKLVAVNGGEVHVEQAIEALWPEVKPGAGRNRLRTVLNRLRQAAKEVVSRHGERLVLEAEVRLDLAQFTSEAREAQALRVHDLTAALAMARSAIARYRGPLLPHDLYEEWAEARRPGPVRRGGSSARGPGRGPPDGRAQHRARSLRRSPLLGGSFDPARPGPEGSCSERAPPGALDTGAAGGGPAPTARGARAPGRRHGQQACCRASVTPV